MRKNSNYPADLMEALHKLEREIGEEAAKSIKPIVLANFDTGRIDKRLRNDFTADHYVKLVLKNYGKHCTYLHQLQVERDDIQWEALQKDLQKWAYNYFLGKGFYKNDGTADLVSGSATESAIALMEARYPYDVNLKSWIATIVQNHCRRAIRSNLRASQVPQENQNSIEDELDSPQFLIDHELNLDLADAIDRLPNDDWKTAILLKLNGLSPAEISEEMGKSASAIYNIIFKAQKALREIWAPTGHKIDEIRKEESLV